MKKEFAPLAQSNLAREASLAALDAKAEGLTVIDVRECNGMTDWIVICESDNMVHTTAIANRIHQALKQQHTSAWHVEGMDTGRWVLLDYSDVVVHVMLSDVRSYYRIEELWDTGIRLDIKNEKQCAKIM